MPTENDNVAKRNIQKIASAIKSLSKYQLLVGVPQTKNESGTHGEIGNAALAWIHTYGSPANNIPPRPFLAPGITKAETSVRQHLLYAAQGAATGDFQKMNVGYNRAGIVLISSIRDVIVQGIQPPLSDKTIKARLREHPSRPGEAEYLKQRKEGKTPQQLFSTGLVTPLVDTGSLLSSISYVVRPTQ